MFNDILIICVCPTTLFISPGMVFLIVNLHRRGNDKFL